MTTITIFSIGLGLSLALSLGIAVYLNKPLTEILVDLCGTEGRARFWSHVTNVSIVLTPLLFAISYRPRVGLETFFQLIRQLGNTLTGLILTVLFMNFTISKFIRRQMKEELTIKTMQAKAQE
jgi:hypothetical protein